MRLDKDICLGGRLNNKEVVGIRLNGYDIYKYEYDERTYVKDQYKDNRDIVEVDVLVTKAHTDLSWMFANCVKLTKINGMNEWNTSNVDRMGGMFYKCESLTSLDLSSFNTSKVTDMDGMFSNCSNLTTINGISNFDTSNVNFISSMFHSCSKLTELDLSSWNFDNVTNMMSMFYGCSSLTSLNMSNCDVSNVTSMVMMLDGCSSLVDFQAPKNISADLKLSTCTSLSHDSLMSIINNLSTVTGKTLTLGSTNLAKLTDEEKAIATNKGWTVSHY